MLTSFDLSLAYLTPTAIHLDRVVHYWISQSVFCACSMLYNGNESVVCAKVEQMCQDLTDIFGEDMDVTLGFSSSLTYPLTGLQ